MAAKPIALSICLATALGVVAYDFSRGWTLSALVLGAGLIPVVASLSWAIFVRVGSARAAADAYAKALLGACEAVQNGERHL